MVDSSKVLEAFCRLLPEIIAAIGFTVRRRRVDSRHAEMILEEFGIDKDTIQNQRALINDLVDFEGIKRDCESAFLICIVSYAALAFVASPIVLFSGFSIWLVAFVVLRHMLRDDGPGDRFRARRLTIIVIAVVLILSAAGKVTTVLLD